MPIVIILGSIVVLGLMLAVIEWWDRKIWVGQVILIVAVALSLGFSTALFTGDQNIGSVLVWMYFTVIGAVIGTLLVLLKPTSRLSFGPAVLISISLILASMVIPLLVGPIQWFWQVPICLSVAVLIGSVGYTLRSARSK